MKTLIEQIKALKIIEGKKPLDNQDIGWNDAIEKVLEILKIIPATEGKTKDEHSSYPPKSKKEIIKELTNYTLPDNVNLQHDDRLIISPQQLILCMEAYKSRTQPEGVCEWHTGDGGVYQLPGCCSVGLKDIGLVFSYAYCPFCGKLIKRV